MRPKMEQANAAGVVNLNDVSPVLRLPNGVQDQSRGGISMGDMRIAFAGGLDLSQQRVMGEVPPVTSHHILTSLRVGGICTSHSEVKGL